VEETFRGLQQIKPVGTKS